MTKKEYDCFLLKRRNGVISRFCFDSKNSIYYQTYIKGSWTEKRSIYKESFEYFYVFEKENGEVNVFCQDICGDVILCILKGGEWKYRNLLHMKYDVITPVQIRAFFYCEDIHLLYNVVDKHTYTEGLVHQIAKNGIRWTSPKVISKSNCYSGFSYHIYKGGKSEITILNTILDGGYKLISRRFHAIDEMWGKEEVIHIALLPYRDFAFLGEEDRKHCLFITQDDNINRVIYQYKEIGLQKNTILFEDKSISSCLLILYNEVLWSLWISGNKLYGCFSENYGRSFTRPKEYRSFDSGLPIKVFYQEYLADKENNYVINEIYVIKRDGNEELFLHDILEESVVSKIDDNINLKYKIDNISFAKKELNHNLKNNEILEREEVLQVKLKNAIEELKTLKDAIKYEKNQISNLQYKVHKEKEKIDMYRNDNYILKEKNITLEKKLLVKEKEILRSKMKGVRVENLSDSESLKTKNINDSSKQVKFSLAKWLFKDENKTDY